MPDRCVLGQAILPKSGILALIRVKRGRAYGPASLDGFK